MLLWFGLGFAAFGLLVGTTAGLSTAQLTTTLLGLLFALISGSIGALLAKLDSEGRKCAGVALLMFSLSATFGLFAGIYVRINDLLRVASTATALSASRVVAAEPPGGYLKSRQLPLTDFLKGEVTSDRMTLPEACKVLQEQGRVEGTP